MVGLRRSLAMLVLGFFFSQYALVALLGPDELFTLYLALAGCYALGFLGLGAEWFWGRWFAMGLGNFGSLFLLLIPKIGPEPVLLFIGLSHLAVTLLLLGEGMASRYEYSERTQERWNFQEESIQLMRRAVTSAGATVPILLIYLLSPRAGEGLGAWLDGLALLALGLGLWGLLRARTYGALGLGVAGAIALVRGLGVVGAAPVGYLLLGGTSVATGTLLYGNFALLGASALLVPAALGPAIARWWAAQDRGARA